jgi:hypothetical protein
MSDEIEVKGQSTENAVLLLAAAEELGLDPGVVRTDSNGSFHVPKDVADKAGFDENGVPKSKAAKEAEKQAAEREMESFKNTTNPTVADEDERAAAAEKRNEAAAKKAAAPAKKAAASKTAAPKSGE